jgi:glucan biosynthesis protein C
MQNRAYFIDHLRGFMFALMAFDHSLHAYAQNWGRFWFIQDFERSFIVDCFYLFNQSAIMPMIFFISGLNVLPSLHRRGFKDYLHHRFIKLGLPFTFCIPFIVPLMTFPRYQLTIDPSIDYWTYWSEIFFHDKLQAGPLWVCYALFLYSFLFIFLDSLFPSLIIRSGKWLRHLIIEAPLQGIIKVFLISAFILGISDLMWGAPWWIGFWKVFYLQGSRFLLYGLYFYLGASVRASGILEDTAFLNRFANHFQQWLWLMVIAGVCYVGYAMAYFDKGAYNDDFRYQIADFFSQGGSWKEFLPFMSVYGFETLRNVAPAILIRTSLQGILCLFQVLFLLSLFYKFSNTPSSLWSSLARCCYAIFLTHEVIVIWLQYFLIRFDLPVLIKFLFVFILGFGASWLISEKVLLRIPRLKKILG